MATSRSRISKINAGSDHFTFSRKTATVGGTVIADYLDPITQDRILVVERVAAAPVKKTKKAATATAKKANSALLPPEPAAAFPGRAAEREG